MTTSVFFRELHRRDRALALGGWLMVAGLIAALAVAPFDARLILGVNPWIKPIKFLSSIAIFLWTMAWFMAETDPRHERRVTRIRWTVLVAMVGEIALIAVQAARGTTSHFNFRTGFDAAVFQVMGVMIVANTVAVAMFIGTLRRDAPPSRSAYLWGIRLGLAMFVFGSLEAFLMIANMAHSVPSPDGGPGLPFVNWSTTVGDLRVAHFIGLHALQALPIAGALLDRAWVAAPAARMRLVSALAIVWVGAMATTLLLALAGRPLIVP